MPSFPCPLSPGVWGRPAAYSRWGGMDQGLGGGPLTAWSWEEKPHHGRVRSSVQHPLPTAPGCMRETTRHPRGWPREMIIRAGSPRACLLLGTPHPQSQAPQLPTSLHCPLAIPASSWLDDFIDWLSSTTCCRLYLFGPNKDEFCPSTVSECVASAGSGETEAAEELAGLHGGAAGSSGAGGQHHC